jgi:hypothetical protein
VNYVGRPTLAHVQGCRIFVTPNNSGLSLEEAEALLAQLPSLIDELVMTEQQRLDLAIERAKACGNEPLVVMLEATLKELYGDRS